MTPSITIDIPVSELDKILFTFDATTADIERASRRAINKTIRYFRRQGLRGISSKLETLQKSILSRFFTSSAKSKKLQGKVWIGLNELPAHRLGKGRQTKKGVRVKKRFFPHAFMPFKKVADGRKKLIFQRKDKNTIELVKISLAENLDFLENLEEKAGRFFLTTFEQELNFEVNIRGLHR